MPPYYYVHRLQLREPADIDAELKRWLAQAYQVGAQRHVTDPDWPKLRRPPSWVHLPREVADAIARGEDPWTVSLMPPPVLWDHRRDGRGAAERTRAQGAGGAGGGRLGARARVLRAGAASCGQTAEVLDGLSQAAHFQGEYAEAIELKERAFAAYRRDGRRAEAAELARWLAFLHGAVHGNMAAASGWMACAPSACSRASRSRSEHGWLALDRAPWTDDPVERERLRDARRSTIARRSATRPRVRRAGAARPRLRRHRTRRRGDGADRRGDGRGRRRRGRRGRRHRRDLLPAAGRLRARDRRQARRAVDLGGRRFVAWGDFVAPTCRLHYGGILIAVGRWAEAEEELLAALGLRGRLSRDAGAPLVRLAGLRVRQGRFEEAERLLEGNESRSAARRVLAAIALGAGRPALAEDLARLCLEAEDPSSPTARRCSSCWSGSTSPRGDLDAAREALARLRGLAAGCGDERVAGAASSRRPAARRGRRRRARARISKRRLDAFAALGLPLEAARAQLELARALAAESPGRRDRGGAPRARALRAARRAPRDADAAAGLLRALGGRPPLGPKATGR